MSNLIPIGFGDIFRYENQEYVFLVQGASGIIYAAKILNDDDSELIYKMCMKTISTNSNRQQNILYCFVKLETLEYKDRVAHFKNAGKDDFSLKIEKLACTLTATDKRQIKEEILRKDAPIAIELKELIKDLKV